MDRWDESVYASDGEEDEAFESSKEQLVFLIDATAPMLEPCELQDEAYEGKSWVEVAVTVAAEILRQKVISAAGDQIAVLFYGTRERITQHAEYGDMDGVWLQQELALPSADAIGHLSSLSLHTFDTKIGSGSADGLAVALKNAFWLSKLMCDKSKQKVSRRILVFTRTQEPVKLYQKGTDYTNEWHQIDGQLQSLKESNTAIQLFPMLSSPDDHFDLQPFWRNVLVKLRGSTSEDSEEMDEAEQVGRIQDLSAVVRSKAHKKRAVGSVRWSIGGGLDIRVKLFQTLQPQAPGAPLKIDGQYNKEVKPSTSLIDRYTGATVTPGEVRKFYPKQPSCRFPKVYLTDGEIKAIKGLGHSGMTLLGFKPLSCLRDHHQVRNSTFMYPDDKAQPGSAAAFIALHEAMLEKESMAVCRLAATNAREPRLVALLAQEEVADEYGYQLEAPGMQIIYLPFADDIRTPETDDNFTGTLRPQPSEQQVAAAAALIATLPISEFYSPLISNPALQRHYTVLESLAAAEEPPAVEEQEDRTLPQDFDIVPGFEGVVQAFKAAMGLNDDEPKKAATKRKAEAAPLDAGSLAALDIEGKAASGNLKSLKLDELKLWLKARGLPVSGKKDELIARICNKLGIY